MSLLESLGTRKIYEVELSRHIADLATLLLRALDLEVHREDGVGARAAFVHVGGAGGTVEAPTIQRLQHELWGGGVVLGESGDGDGAILVLRHTQLRLREVKEIDEVLVVDLQVGHS